MTGRRSLIRPRSSGFEISLRSCKIQGFAASSAGPAERTPGSASRLNARSGGNIALRLTRADDPSLSTSRQHLDRGLERLALSGKGARDDAQAGHQALQLLLVAAEALIGPVEVDEARRDRRSVPSTAWLTSEVDLLATAELLKNSRSPGAAVLDEAVAELLKRTCRFLRVSDCSEVST